MGARPYKCPSNTPIVANCTSENASRISVTSSSSAPTSPFDKATTANIAHCTASACARMLHNSIADFASVKYLEAFSIATRDCFEFIKLSEICTKTDQCDLTTSLRKKLRNRAGKYLFEDTMDFANIFWAMLAFE